MEQTCASGLYILFVKPGICQKYFIIIFGSLKKSVLIFRHCIISYFVPVQLQAKCNNHNIILYDISKMRCHFTNIWLKLNNGSFEPFRSLWQNFFHIFFRWCIRRDTTANQGEQRLIIMHLERIKCQTRYHIYCNFYLLLTSLGSSTITWLGSFSFLDSFAAIEQPAVPPPTTKILQLMQQIASILDDTIFSYLNIVLTNDESACIRF